MELLHNRKILIINKSKIWNNIDGFDYEYICATELYLLSMLSYVYNIVIDCGIGAPGHGKDVVYGLKDTEESFLSMLITTVQLPGESTNNSQFAMYTSNINTYIIIEMGCQKHISDPTRAHGLVDHGKDRGKVSKRKWMEH